MALVDLTGHRAPVTPCRGCQRPVVWIIYDKPDGTKGRMPLDATAPVYELVEIDRGTGEVTATRKMTAGVSHFYVCTRREFFKREGAERWRSTTKGRYRHMYSEGACLLRATTAERLDCAIAAAGIGSDEYAALLAERERRDRFRLRMRGAPDRPRIRVIAPTHAGASLCRVGT